MNVLHMTCENKSMWQKQTRPVVHTKSWSAHFQPSFRPNWQLRLLKNLVKGITEI